MDPVPAGRAPFPGEDGVLSPRRKGSWLLSVYRQPDPSSPDPKSSVGNPSLIFSTPRPPLCLSVVPSGLTAWPQTTSCLLLKLGQVQTSCHHILSLYFGDAHTLSRFSLDPTPVRGKRPYPPADASPPPTPPFLRGFIQVAIYKSPFPQDCFAAKGWAPSKAKEKV